MDNIYVNFETRVGTFSRFSDDIGIISFNGNVDITALEMELFCNKMYKVMDNKQFYLINIVKEIGSFPAEVWGFLSSDVQHNKTILGSVITSKSLGYAIQAKFVSKQYLLSFTRLLFVLTCLLFQI